MMHSIPILAYHLVTDRPDLGFTRTSLRQFEAQMQWLSDRGYRTVTVSEYHRNFDQILHEHQQFPTVVLTFDDAYASIDLPAAIMDKFGFTGTCFAIGAYVGKRNDWDYQFLFRRYRHADISLLRELKSGGWEIGSHTQHHAFLPRLSDRSLRSELRGSRQMLSDRLGAPVSSISYPFGATNKKICRLAKEAKYHCGVGLGQRSSEYERLGNMCLPRLGVYTFDRLRSFANKVEAFGDTKSWMFKKQRMISQCTMGTVALNMMRSALKRGVF